MAKAATARIAAAVAVDYARFDYPRPPCPPPRRDFADWIAEASAPFVIALDRRGMI